MDDDEVEEGRSLSGKPGVARNDIASEATGHWPLPSDEKRAVVMAGTCSKAEVAPLRAMIMERRR
jgi:hypothetical protein